MLPGAVEACHLLREAGFVLVVVTNQPDVARGTQRQEVVEAINRAVAALVSVDDVRVCYHDDADACACRKPAPGMILAAAEAWHIDLASSFMVGDRWRDVEAGQRAGCQTVLVGDQLAEGGVVVPDHQAASLGAAAEIILKQSSRETVPTR
jgi:D-glycero-D-manno-heptose 1,7-bisphosphate phosphatase